MMSPAVRQKFDAMIRACNFPSLPPEKLPEANELIADCRDDLLRNQWAADDIIEDCRKAIEGLRVEA